MANDNYTVDNQIHIWNDTSGYRFVVADDRDGLDLIELRYIESDGKAGPCLVLTPKEATLVAHALLQKAASITGPPAAPDVTVALDEASTPDTVAPSPTRWGVWIANYHPYKKIATLKAMRALPGIEDMGLRMAMDILNSDDRLVATTQDRDRVWQWVQHLQAVEGVSTRVGVVA